LIALPQLQEVDSHPCDIGKDRSELEKVPDFNGIDFTSLGDDWNGKQGIFAPANVRERAKWVRKWLRGRPEKNIVVVTHAEFLLSLTNEDVEQGWANAEVRQYTFQTEDDNDEARLVFSKEEVQTGGVVPGDMS